jgi:hypothetical protein
MAKSRKVSGRAASTASTKSRKALNRSLHAARATKQDEFHTYLSRVENELKHFTHYSGKTFLCGGDDAKVRNCFHYFAPNFNTPNLENLITVPSR